MSAISTITVRPISYEEIAALAEHPQHTLDAYEIRSHPVIGDALVAMTYQVSTKSRLAGRGQAHSVVYPVVPDTRGREGTLRYDSSQEPVGLYVHFHSHSMFGSNSGVTLYTSPEAEQAVASMGDSGRRDDWHPGDSRLSIAVPDDKNGVEVPLMPVYGAEVNTSVIIKDVSPEEVTARIEKALRAEFGDTVKIQKLQSRPVADIRVNVYNIADDKPIAVNVLEAEAHTVGSSAYRTEYVTKDMVIGS